jgi:hypothetical protein
MVPICKRCKRANPRDAIYCHHDGVLLAGKVGGDIPADGSAMNIGARPFSVPLVFPSGRQCFNFVQLSLACSEEAESALELLRKGHMETFLAGQGRTDLAAAAHAAARIDDRERGLDDFVGRLPAFSTPAKLHVEPMALDFGTVRVGEDHRRELVLHNKGMRLLYGSASCDAAWLSLGDGPAVQGRAFQFRSRDVLIVQLLGRHLRAFEKPQDAQIILESNGGTITVAVRVHVPVKPFPEGVLAGAQSPRQLAHQAKESPKEAAVLIENGAVARWYSANGWTYPVRGPAASGVAAVQQLFEALGLVKPPRVELSEDAIRLRGAVDQKVEHTLAVITNENRSVIAHGTSDQAWLEVGRTIFRGRSAFLPLIVMVPGRAGATLQAIVAIEANGGQRFAVPVTLAIAAAVPSPPAQIRPVASTPAATAAATPVKAAPAVPMSAAVPPPPPAAADTARGHSLLITILPALLLIAAASLGVVHDWLATDRKTALPDVKAPVDSTPRLEVRYHDVTRDDVLENLYLPDRQPTMRFGLVMKRNGKEIGAGVNIRRLTFDPWGRTNNTCLRFDKQDERLFGSGGKGHWQESAAQGWKDDQGQEHDGVKSVWIWDDKRIEATQFVELVRGEQSGLLDTCRVRYLLENRDAKEHVVGIRFLLDTFIGGNDAVPFTIPGEPDLCDTMKDLPAQAKDKKIPDFLQALEKPDLAHPGTIAHLRLKLQNLEPPARVTLGAWPNEKLRVLDKQANGPMTLWDVPLLPLKSLDLDDSAIAIYWQEQPLKAGGKREVGFEYGLWNLASQGSRLATLVDGAFRPDGELTVVAYIQRSGQDQDDETVSLKLPDGFKLLEGTQTQHLPKLPKDAKNTNVPITWRVQAGPTGSYELTVTSSTGLSQTLKVEIRKSIY